MAYQTTLMDNKDITTDMNCVLAYDGVVYYRAKHVEMRFPLL